MRERSLLSDEAAALSERLAQEAERVELEALAAKRGRMAREADLLRFQLGLPPLSKSPLLPR